MTDKKNILEELYADVGAFDPQRIVDCLKPFLNIQRGGHAIFFTKEGHALKNEDKMLAYFLVKKLLNSQGVIEEAGISAKEVHEQTELPKGTVDPGMQKLKKDGLLIGSGSNYEIPNRRVDAIIERLEKYK